MITQFITIIAHIVALPTTFMALLCIYGATTMSEFEQLKARMYQYRITYPIYRYLIPAIASWVWIYVHYKQGV